MKEINLNIKDLEDKITQQKAKKACCDCYIDTYKEQLEYLKNKTVIGDTQALTIYVSIEYKTVNCTFCYIEDGKININTVTSFKINNSDDIINSFKTYLRYNNIEKIVIGNKCGGAYEHLIFKAIGNLVTVTVTDNF